MERRAAAKLMRLEMSPELREMLRCIPAQVRENVKSDIIYLGEGVAQGMERERMEVEVRVFLLDGKKMASVRARNKVHVARFGTTEEQKTFAREATRTILSKMN
jgi:hypothetical protein